ncbi:MAG TPA: hypothetical protein VE988_27350, partial [Gemmataceae bacterium]|nr:hypothetical protein [Gemmataceae bacterium]
ARTAARQPDLVMMQKLRKWFDSRPDLKMPRVIAVLTHIDLLAPAMEWQPPYQWPPAAGSEKVRLKEQQIAAAVAAAQEQLGELVSAVVPLCAADGRVFGVEQWLLPTLVDKLDEARAVAMLRCLRAEVDARKIRKVVDQLLAAGKEIAAVLWEAARK